MADIQALRAIRYARAEQSSVVAPPYDILDADDKAALLAKDAHNIVAVDLPHAPAKEAGPDAVYAEAAERLRRWLAEGVLARDEQPGLYVYHQHFRIEGRAFVRKMFFARLRLEEFGRGQVFPHEQTFGGPKEDRLKLTRATRCNVSPIFSLYSDPENRVAAAFETAVRSGPAATATQDGVENKLWCVSEEGKIAAVREMMSPRPVFIADGHHRYGTALNYRQSLTEALGGMAAATGSHADSSTRSGPLSDDDPANFVLTVFCAMEDPGAVILPTHRVLTEPAISAEQLRAALADRFEWTPAGERDAAACAARLAQHGPQAVGVYDGAADAFAVVRPKEPDLLREFEPGRAPAWRRLSYAILHGYIIDECITPRLNGGQPPAIQYVKPLPDALRAARETGSVAFLMQPCTMAELRDVCTAGELMPQKTTYFYPKLATGFVINPLYE
jgi:uncharacterized protein (DUF1015 family)